MEDSELGYDPCPDERRWIGTTVPPVHLQLATTPDREWTAGETWSQGGKTVAENCRMLCKPCNRRKGAT